jgi:hypothetical protein
MQTLPLGSQDFEDLRLRNSLYVDKTKYVLDIINQSKYMFFSRPRRMGKSLLCSTLKCVYEGRQGLFEGLYIYDKIDWEAIACPVIHIDFSAVPLKEQTLAEALPKYMHGLANKFLIQVPTNFTSAEILKLLLEELSKVGKKVVVIVDEYDKALNDFLDDKQMFEENRAVLRNFFGILKPSDNLLEKVFLTGVSKFGKVSVFSQLNNITDYSTYETYATMCGYTQTELEHYFADYIVDTTQKLEVSKNALLQEMKRYYNGYSYDGVTTVYNPYSVLNFFKLQKFYNYWYDTGTPTFLIKALREQKIQSFELEKIQTDPVVLDMTSIEITNVIALLFQTGYLTIKQVIRKKFKEMYRLGFPNAEVKQAFSQYILSDYMQNALDLNKIKYASPMRDALENKDFPAMQQIAQAVYASIVYQLHERKSKDSTQTKDEIEKAIEAESELMRKEMFYHSLFHVLMNATGFRTESEILTNLGRIDMAVETDETLYLFEFKVNESAEIAFDQIMNKGYAEKYQTTDYEIFAVGINFSTEIRNIEALTYRKLK